jgi:hypothetical protein
MRTIVLAERGGDDLEHLAIRAVDGFKLIATMNRAETMGRRNYILLSTIAFQRSGYLPLTTDTILS